MCKKNIRKIILFLTVFMISIISFTGKVQAQDVNNLSVRMILPVEGRTPETVSSVVLGDSNKYTIKSLSYYHGTTQMSSTDTFVLGEKYTIFIHFKPKSSSYNIPINAKVKLNELDMTFYGAVSDGYGTKTFKLDYTVVEKPTFEMSLWSFKEDPDLVSGIGKYETNETGYFNVHNVGGHGQRALPGQQITVNARPNEGYHFVEWQTAENQASFRAGNGTRVSIQSTYTFTMPSTNYKLFGVYEPDKLTIKFNTNGGNAISNQSIDNGGTITQPVNPTKSGYVFEGWYSDSELTKRFNFASYIYKATTLYAKWIPTAYAVQTININSSTTNVLEGELKSFDVSTNTNHATASKYGSNTSWLKSKKGSSNWAGFGSEAPTAVDDGVTHYGLRVHVKLDDGYSFPETTTIKFNGVTYNKGYTTIQRYEWGAYVIIDLGLAKPVYTVSFESNGGTLVDNQFVIDGEKVIKPSNPTREGYAFDGWYVNPQLTNKFNFNEIIDSDLTLFARWIGKIDVTEIDGTSFIFQPILGALYHKAYIYTEDNILVNSYDVSSNSDGSIIEKIKEGCKESTLALGHCSTDFTGEYKYKIIAYNYSGNPIAETEQIILTYLRTNGFDRLLTQNIPTKYTITFNSNGGSSISNVKVYDGYKLTKPTNPKRDGYTFNGWYTNSSLTSSFNFDSPIYSNMTLYAKWIEKTISVSYTSHVQQIGWQEYVSDGELSGTSGKGLRLEAMKIKLAKQPYAGNIEYRTHIQSIGWETSFKKNNEITGTSGKGLRLEAIQIKLTGDISKYYDVYYRVHAQSFGWLGWARNGESAGTAGYGYRLEAIEIKLIQKNQTLSEYGKISSFHDRTKLVPNVYYTSHVQSIGWQNYVKNGELSGTSGKGLRLEAMKIKLTNLPFDGNIEYRTHIQNIGWETEFKKNDEITGTSGKGLRLEAIQIKLTGDISKYYDVYYRVHAQNFGWLGWARNGENSGTQGYGYRLEAIEIKLVKKGTTFSEYGKIASFKKK